MGEYLTPEEKTIIKNYIWKLEKEIKDFKKESIDYKAMYDDSIKQISDREEVLKTLNKLIEKDNKEKTVKDILADLVDEENSNFLKTLTNKKKENKNDKNN